MLAQRKQAQAQQAQGMRSRAAAEAARCQEVQEQRGAQNVLSGVAASAVPGAAAVGSATSTVTTDASSSMPSDSFTRLRAMQLQQQVSATPGHRLGQQQQQLQQQRRISMTQCTTNASPREMVTSPISPREQQQQQLQGLGLVQASPIGFPGQQKPQQPLSLPRLGPGMGPELQDRYQQQQQDQEAASTMDAEERKRQELLEQTLLSQNDDFDPPQPPAPSPRRQDHEQQYQWPGSTAAATFKNSDVTERGYRQAQPIGLGGQQQQQLQQMNRQQPRVGPAGSPQDNGRQQMEDAWRRRRSQLEQQQKGIASGTAVHGSFQDQGQSQQELHYSSSSSSSSSPPPSVSTTSSAAAGASAGPAQDVFRGGLVVDRPRSEPRVEDQRRYRQRQYQQLAQLAHIQQQQQRQGLVQGLMQGGNSHPTTASAASGVFRSPSQRGTGATLQQQQQQQQVEWARRSVPAPGQSHAGVISSELPSTTPQSLTVVDEVGGMPMEAGLGGGGMVGHSQQPQSAVSSYSGWQSVEERRRSENSNRKR